MFSNISDHNPCCAAVVAAVNKTKTCLHENLIPFLFGATVGAIPWWFNLDMRNLLHDLHNTGNVFSRFAIVAMVGSSAACGAIATRCTVEYLTHLLNRDLNFNRRSDIYSIQTNPSQPDIDRSHEYVVDPSSNSIGNSIDNDVLHFPTSPKSTHIQNPQEPQMLYQKNNPLSL
jgi:hypothetical protein